MKKLATLLAIVVAGITVGAGPASATGTSTTLPYPPTGPALTLSPSTVTPGGTFTATLSGCTAGETVEFTVAGDSATATCGTGPAAFRRPAAPTGPTASATLTAPTAPGTYAVTGTGLTSGVTETATLTVAAAAGGGLPATGSDSAPTVQIATGIIVVGVGLATVGGLRRRKRAAAA